jgi:hypothetical protein
LDTGLAVRERSDGGVEILHGEIVVADTIPATLDLQPPAPPDYLQAIEASRGYVGFQNNLTFPGCFVCGVQRARGDGLCVYAGSVTGRDIVAAPWVPDASLDRGDGKVRAEFMSAALDCPGYFALSPGTTVMLLAQFTVHLDRLVHVDESCTLIGWRIGSNGRKHEAGTALFDEDGELCGGARALWIEPRA